MYSLTKIQNIRIQVLFFAQGSSKTPKKIDDHD